MNNVLHQGEVYAAACAALWAVAVVLFRLSGDVVPPVLLNLIKNSIGLALLLLTAALVGAPFAPPDMSSADWGVLLASGLIGIAIADSMFFFSLNRLGAGRSAIVDCLYSPFVILCASLYLGEALSLTLLLAAALVGSAIVVGNWEPDQPDPDRRRADRAAILIGVASMFLMAFGIVIAKPVLERADPWWATWVRLAGALPLLLAQGLSRPYRAQLGRILSPGRHWRVLLPGSVVGAYLALILWILGFKYAQAGVAGVLNQTSNVMVLFLAALFLREPLTRRKVIAIFLGFAGAVLVVV